jgi:GAF domain-containing protein
VTDFETLLRRVGTALDRGAIDQRTAAHYLGAHVCRQLYCSRVAFWTLSDAPDRVAVLRIGGFDAIANRPLSEAVALEIDTPCAWLAELVGRGGFACADTAVDPGLRALHAAYLAPQRINAVLQATIGANTRACGFIGCEQIGSARAWTQRDAVLLKRVASAISLQRHRQRGALPA